jgi:crotonobetainyl-CoA:carnitine CoA-transferase CaiB-like acyl-CoA transferase
MTSRDRPLEGVRVLDLSNLMAAPMAAMYLADFGADVIKVEHPERGDELRNWGRKKDDVGLFFKVANRNKRTITLNLSKPEGQDIARRLAENVDVVIENYRPGTMEKWGLGWDRLSDANAGLVMARITGYGQTGPYSQRPGFGTLAEAFSGYAAITGYADQPPLLPAFGLGDASTAIHAAYGIALALLERERNGGAGQYIDLGLYEGLFTLLGPHVVDYDQLGAVQERAGSRIPHVAPRNTYRTTDGKWVAIAGATQRTFERICGVLKIEDLLDDPRFTTNQERVANAEALDDRIQEAIGRLNVADVLARFDDAQAPVGPAHDITGIFEDEHYAARENIVSIDDEELGPIRMQNVVPRLSKTPGRIDHAGPPKGASNAAVYEELLELDKAELARLAEAGVI